MKHLKRFKIYEAEGEKPVSDDKIKEITDDISKVLKGLDNGKNMMRNHIEDLKSLQGEESEDRDENNQIDDTVIQLEGAEKLIEDCITKYDEANKLLKNYLEKGEQYLYGG